MTAIQTGVSALALTGAAAELEVGASLFSGAMSIAVGQMLGGLFRPSAPGFTATMAASGQADIDLGDGNTLRFDKASSQMQILDSQGDVTTVYGDPHLVENGAQVGSFYGPMTFQLQDGTKITVDTKAGTEGTGVEYADTVTITRGANAVVVSGLDQESAQALSVSSSQNGYRLDAATGDGLTLDQAAGGQWTDSLTGGAVSQSDLDLTRPASDGAIIFGQALGQLLGGFLATGLFSGRSGASATTSLQTAPHAAHARPSPLEMLGLGLTLGLALRST